MIDSALAAEAAAVSLSLSLIHGPREMYPFGQVATDVDGQKRIKSRSTGPGNGERVITGETMACGDTVQSIRMPTLGRKAED